MEILGKRSSSVVQYKKSPLQLVDVAGIFYKIMFVSGIYRALL